MTVLLLTISLVLSAEPETQTVLVVVGAPGTDEFADQFRKWANRWQETAKRGEAEFLSVGKSGGGSKDREDLKKHLSDESTDSIEPLWLILIGHGTFDGHTAKFNLRGPDVSATELSEWLADLKRPLAVINCASCSSPFMNRLAGNNRVIVTATKSGYEHNFARFGDYMSSAINDLKSDLDKDEQTSLLEAYLSASAKVAEFYEGEGRLATEHALLDDNGDGLGTPATWFRGVRATKVPKDGAKADGLRANQFHLVRSEREKNLPADLRVARDHLEQELANLRESKEKLDDDDYYKRIEAVLVKLARLYESIDARKVGK